MRYVDREEREGAWRLPVLITLFAAASLFVTPAGAVPTAYDPAENAEYAAALGIPIGEVEIAWQNSEAITALMEATWPLAGESDLDLWIEGDVTSPTVHFRTDRNHIAAEVEALANEHGLPFANEGGPATVYEVTQELNRTVGTELGNIPEVMGFYIDTSSGTLVIDATLDVTRTAQSIVAQTESSLVNELQIEVRLTDETSDHATIRGGVALTSCTAGFTATYGGYVGFWTAAHCGTQNYWANTSGSGTSAGTGTIRATAYNSNSDIRFLSIASGDVIADTFYGSSSSSPTATASPVSVGTGVTVCHRGKTTGYACGQVQSIYYTPTYSGACPSGSCNASFVSVGANAAGGDSGGPWFSGANPIGIHKGGSSSFSIYSKLQYAPGSVYLG